VIDGRLIGRADDESGSIVDDRERVNLRKQAETVHHQGADLNNLKEGFLKVSESEILRSNDG
jgi:hypothetical protein